MAKSRDLEVAVAEVVDHMRIKGSFTPVLREVIERKLAAAAAKESGIKVSSAELQRAADAFRYTRGLHKESDTKKWMRSHGISHDAFEQHLETSLLVHKLKDRIAGKAKRKKLLSAPGIQDAIRELAYREWIAKSWK